MKYYFNDDKNRWAATLVSYNAGPGKVIDRMSVCKATKGCDITAWFNGLNLVNAPKENKKLYGKPLYLRVNEYPDNIINVRAPKYKPLWDSILIDSAPPTIQDL